METLTLRAPAMYGDHHVLEVRRILFELPGVVDVYASSCFQIVEVQYDPEKIDAKQIEARLEQAGYLDELPIPTEMGAAAIAEGNGKGYFRHTVVYENAQHAVSFAQNVSYSGRPLWPCPGFGTLKSSMPEED